MFLLSFVYLGLCLIGWLAAHLLTLKYVRESRVGEAFFTAYIATAFCAANVLIAIPYFFPSVGQDKHLVIPIIVYLFCMQNKVAQPVVRDFMGDPPP